MAWSNPDAAGRRSSLPFVKKVGKKVRSFVSDNLSYLAEAALAGPRPKCAYSGCNKPCYYDEARGIYHDYCGRTHAEQDKARCRSSSMGGYPRPPLRVARQAAAGNNASMHPIRFYNRGEPYYEFTNFYLAVIKIDGKDWPSSEHYFQAQKFIGTPFVEYIRKLQTPRMAFEYTRNPNVSLWERSDWKEIKVKVMTKALMAKFLQHRHLQDQLLGTNNRWLIEHTPYDTFWGNGGNDTGENMLGRLLMKLRSELRGEPSPDQSLTYVSDCYDDVQDQAVVETDTHH